MRKTRLDIRTLPPISTLWDFELLAPWCLFLPVALLASHINAEGKERSFCPDVILGNFCFLYSLRFQARLLLAADSAADGNHGRTIVLRAVKSLEQPHSLVEERGILPGACGGFNGLIGAIGLFLPAMCPQPFTDLPLWSNGRLGSVFYIDANVDCCGDHLSELAT